MRKIKKTQIGLQKVDGAGVKVNRVFARPHVQDFDPFLFLDAFDSTNPDDYKAGFPWHPHRGIETITYLVYGNIEHGDNIGNQGSITDGSCQWMTAGRGILHQEMPQPVERMLGIQLWLNLPQKDKMAPPAYHDIQANTIPTIAEENGEIKIISGQYKNNKGPVEGFYVKAMLLDVNLKSNAQWQLAVNNSDTLFVYILEGSARFSQEKTDFIPAKTAVLFEEGTQLFVQTGEQGARFILAAGQPLHEPIAWDGSIVMNTQEELAITRKELANKTFIK